MADRIILACTVILALVYLYATTLIPVLAIGDPLGPKAFPRLLGIAMLIAAGLLALELWRDRGKQENQEPQAPRFEWPIIVVLGAVVIWAGLYFWFFEDLGYIVATTIFLIPMTMWFHRGKWITNIVCSVLFSVSTYFLFVELETRLPSGLLPF
jgi:putative tricarboxylic transport membrane protein